MENYDWVKGYIDKLLSSDLGKEGTALRDEKIPYINMPFYKYCYVIEDEKRNEETIDYAINNFSNDELYFQNPAKFNDPFDCYLGFSQTQVIRDLLMIELRRQKKLTPQMRKAVNVFFSQNQLEDTNIDSLLLDGNLDEIISMIFPIISASFGDDAELLGNIFSSELLKNDDAKQLFVKLIKNTLTIRDKQQFVDMIYGNEQFKEYIKSKTFSLEGDTILEMAKHDMKISIENDPSSFMSDNNGETFSILDFFMLVVSAVSSKEEIPEIDNVKKSFNDIANETLFKSRELISDQFRVTCLSERMDSPLMWSHYANKHFGFCSEYDFTHTMTKRYSDLILAQLMLFPVTYSQKRPLISKAFFDSKTKLNYIKNKKLPPNLINNIMRGLLYKSEDWEYEKEWRILQLKCSETTMKLPPARKVFLGANMEEYARNRIIEIANKKKIPVFQMYLKMDQYKFDYYKV